MVEIKKQNSEENHLPLKLLMIRLSSVGDIIQALGIIEPFLKKFPNTEIHWVVRDDLKELLENNPRIQKIWTLKRKDGFRGLHQLSQTLRAEKYHYVYDAHNNLRSHYLCLYLNPSHFLRRTKNRLKRFLLFQFRMNLFPKKFIQQESFVTPLQKWGIQYTIPTNSELYISPKIEKAISQKIPFVKYIALIPSAAWELKRWPLDHFKKLIEIMPDTNFIILGGKEDYFCQDLIPNNQSHRVMNLAGKLSLIESCAVVKAANLTIGNDTGISHAADQLGRPLIQMIGPVLFGYPAKNTSIVLETPLPCRPCTKDGRGVCKNKIYKQCLTQITPEAVANLAKVYL